MTCSLFTYAGSLLASSQSRLIVAPEQRGLSPVAHSQGGTEAGVGRGCHGGDSTWRNGYDEQIPTLMRNHYFFHDIQMNSNEKNNIYIIYIYIYIILYIL